MNTSTETQTMVPLWVKNPKPFALWASCLVCVFYGLKFSVFLFSHHFYILVFSLALSYLAVAVSLFLLSRASILFALINLGIWAYVITHDYSLHGKWLLTNSEAWLTFGGFILKQIFHLWLVVYSGYLYKKGLLK